MNPGLYLDNLRPFQLDPLAKSFITNISGKDNTAYEIKFTLR